MKSKKYEAFYQKLGLLKNHKHKKEHLNNLIKNNQTNDLLNFTKQVVVINDELAKKEEIHIHDNNFNKKIISLKDISLFYKRLYHPMYVIFDNLNLDIYDEQTTCIVGPNGIGKTTLFELIIQVKKPNKGQVIFYDDAIKKNPYKYISMQTQDFNFPTGLLVKDVVEFIIELQQIDISKNIGEYKRMLRIFQLDKIWLNKASKLSGGQQQRLNLFISLLNHPKVLLLDEYATGLDIKTKELIENFLLNYIKTYKTTLLFISHELDGLTQYANRYVILSDHHVIVDLSKEEVIKRFESVNNLIKYYVN